MDQEIRKEIKTFLINADSSSLPNEEQLLSLFLGGFEVYSLPETRLISIEAQVECLAALFKELIVLFSIDSPLAEGEWPELLRHLSQAHGSRIRMGVLHRETDPQRRAALEHLYLNEIRVQAGCIPVGVRKSLDLQHLRRVLTANEANGRRKAIRMVCSGRLNVVVKQRRLEARLVEISVSHFLCIFKDADPGLEDSARLKDVQLMAGGPVLNVDAVVMLKRRTSGADPEMVYVCGFVQKGKSDLGLEPADTAVLIRLIKNYCTEQIEESVQSAFQKRWKARVMKGAPQTQPVR